MPLDCAVPRRYSRWLLLLSACSSSSTTSGGPLSTSGNGATAASHPEWSQYTFTIADNGGDGSEELSTITGAFADAAYKVKFYRFDYGPPLVQAATAGDVDLGYVGTVPPITGAAEQFGFKIVATEHGADPTKAAENIIVPRDSPIQTLSDLRGKKIAIPQGEFGPWSGAAGTQERRPDAQGRRTGVSEPGSGRHRFRRRARWTPGRSGTRSPPSQ